jgi:DNA-binding GntR family transcriptional regulator
LGGAGPGSSALDRRTSGSQVADYIRERIFDGSLRHGDHVPQDEIAERLGVSRIPVREAIIALEREGWLTNEPHRGAFVHGLDANSVRDYYVLIGLLYGLAALRVTERASDEEITRLRDAERAVQATSDPDELTAANGVFLRRLFELADSSRLMVLARSITGIVPGSFFALVPGTAGPQKKSLAAVVRAIRARDGQRAADEFLALMDGHADRVIALLRSRDVLWVRPDPSAAASS